MELLASTVRIPTSESDFIVGWIIRGEARLGAVLLLHGVRANRLEMLERAKFLARAGYSVLLIDLPGHGESSGEKISFGARESAGVAVAMNYLHRELPGERIGVIGVSLGAASLVLSQPQPAPDAVVLESMYPTIEEATEDRLAIRFGAAGAKLAPLLYWQLRLQIGVSAKDLRPIDKIAALGCPLLIASGTKDRHTTWSESQRIYSAALAPKELWAVEGAAHVDLYRYAPAEYERRILEFFSRYIRRAA
jgi:fermentation-respiration switch protein FrsA (DUF1100 family)